MANKSRLIVEWLASRKSKGQTNVQNIQSGRNWAPRIFKWFFAAFIVPWCLCWLCINGWLAIRLTFFAFADAGWLSLIFIISPCFYLWMYLAITSVAMPLNLGFLSLASLGGDFPEEGKMKIRVGAVVAPALLALALMYIGPYLYPISPSKENKVAVRLLPFFGGRGYR